MGCGQKIDVPNYIWLKLILSICLIPRAHNAGGWWGRCQEACWLAEANNLGSEISARDKMDKSQPWGRVAGVFELSFSVFQEWLEGPWKGLKVQPPVLKADLTKTIQTGNVTHF